jgi:hypothetical protein
MAYRAIHRAAVAIEADLAWSRLRARERGRNEGLQPAKLRSVCFEIDRLAVLDLAVNNPVVYVAR